MSCNLQGGNLIFFRKFLSVLLTSKVTVSSFWCMPNCRYAT